MLVCQYCAGNWNCLNCWVRTSSQSDVLDVALFLQLNIHGMFHENKFSQTCTTPARNPRFSKINYEILSRNNEIWAITRSFFKSLEIFLVIMRSLSCNYEMRWLSLLIQWIQCASVEDKITKKTVISVILQKRRRESQHSDSRSRKQWCGSTALLRGCQPKSR